MSDPFKIEGPAVISFSGGRTSGYMLWRILQAHGGTLPDDVKVVFANTGKEMPETLDFVRDCGANWNVPITWVEYRSKTSEGKQHEFVDHATASRNGEPYSALIEDRKYLPNPFARFCTVELKIRPMHRVIRGWGWEDWLSCIGIRADEPRRVAKVRNRGGSNETPDETPVMPLVDAGINVRDVVSFWDKQPFDLQLKVDAKGNSIHGNCDLCFLKKANAVYSLIRENPKRAIWWMEQEARVSVIGAAGPSGAMFQLVRPTYRQMYDSAMAQREMIEYDDEALQDCMCTD
jgi:3'-phosphoadenosine 5'-phosphosulfate sulfotransferase (PAPS reductase)/FAD synthetase